MLVTDQAFNPPPGQLDAGLWFWRCRAETVEKIAQKMRDEAQAQMVESLKIRRKADTELEAMGRQIAKLNEQIAGLRSAAGARAG